MPDAVGGYELAALRITDPRVIAASGSDTHPLLVPSADPAAQVDGTVFEITAADLEAADDYEADDYARIEVPLRSGLRAWVYVFDAERARAVSLLDAQDRALELFAEAGRRHLVRAGPNTLLPYADNPPDRVISADDIVFLDFGPVFAEWEADVGRTIVLGGDSRKSELAGALPVIWQRGRDYFDSHPDVTGEKLYAHVAALAERDGWEFAGSIAGHLLGEFPHNQISGSELECYIAPGNSAPMRRLDPAGRACHWILEVHIADRARQTGGFHEELLDLRR